MKTSSAEITRVVQKCRLCSRSSPSIWFVAWDHEIHRCRKCGFMFATRLAGAPVPGYGLGYHYSFIERDIQADTRRRYAATLKAIGNAMLPFEKAFRKIGHYEHINVIAQKKINEEAYFWRK